MRNYSSARIIQLSILPPVAQPCPPQEDTAGLCVSDSTPTTSRRNRKGGASRGFSLNSALCALRSALCALCALCVLGVASFALLQPAHYHTYFAGT
jgi:hypothetical protein